jgi:hypothetical protein
MDDPEKEKEPVEESPKEGAKQEPAKDPVDAALSTLSSLKAELGSKDEEIATLKGEIAKKDDKIQRVVDYHNREVARLTSEHQAELSKIKNALREALLNDDEE